jgi:hypothetical protein
MQDDRYVSDRDPVYDPESAHLAMRVLALLDAMGLMELSGPVSELHLANLKAAAATAAGAGIGRHVQPMLGGQPTHREVAEAMRRLAEALEESPLPGPETRQLAGILGWNELARLVGSSPVSLRRYAAGTREAPDELAYRIHWLAKVVADLRGAYNDAGIRRWFERARPQLGSRAPAELLVGEWSPDEPQVESVRRLAAGLAGAGAT